MLPLLLIVTLLTSTTHPVFAQAVQHGAQPDSLASAIGNLPALAPTLVPTLAGRL